MVRHYAHEFYTKQCQYNIIYSEGNSEISDMYRTDFSLFTPSSKTDYGQVIKNRRINFYQSGSLLKSVITK
jgi:hypothetical protein